MLPGLYFEQASPAFAPAPNRADIACFVGFVGRSSRYRAHLPGSLRTWLRDQGLIESSGAPSEQAVTALLHIPVPIESWSTFNELFDATSSQPCYLAAAVRSFFAQGGRKCYVVRAGDASAAREARRERLSQIGELVPAWSGNLAAQAPEDPLRWRGAAHVFGLTDVSFLCLPDLPLLVAEQFNPEPEPVPPRVPQPFFIECSQEPARDAPARRDALGAPRCDATGYRDWGTALNMLVRMLDSARGPSQRKDVQIIAGLPLPATHSDAERDVLSELVELGVMQRVDASTLGVSSARVQLAFPWLAWSGSAELPERIEPPDGVLAGVMARGTLLSGTYNSFADQPLYQITRFEPQLTRQQLDAPRPLTRPTDPDTHSLRQRVSLLGRTVDGNRLLSDVTTSADAAWRPANVNRLMNVWVRAMQQAGQDVIFDVSNELLWAELRRRLQFVGENLFRVGALAGRNPQEAFEVRCDRSTMSESDLDGGRLIAEVSFAPAIPIDEIRITLSLNEAQGVSVRQAAN